MQLCRNGLMRNVLLRDCLPTLADSGASRRPAVQRQDSFATVSFPVAQFNSSQKPFVAFGNVPCWVATQHVHLHHRLDGPGLQLYIPASEQEFVQILATHSFGVDRLAISFS
jgi:hypothetical protein